MTKKIDLHFSTNYDSEDSLEILEMFKQEDKLTRLAAKAIGEKDQMEIAQGKVLSAKKALSLNENIGPEAQKSSHNPFPRKPRLASAREGLAPWYVTSGYRQIRALNLTLC